MKENKCKLCGWIGRTHLHHIIPLCNDGSTDSENIIELCPNHHSEATIDEKEFRILHNLIGKKKSNEELEALKEFAFLYQKLAFSDFYELYKEYLKILELMGLCLISSPCLKSPKS